MTVQCKRERRESAPNHDKSFNNCAIANNSKGCHISVSPMFDADYSCDLVYRELGEGAGERGNRG